MTIRNLLFCGMIAITTSFAGCKDIGASKGDAAVNDSIEQGAADIPMREIQVGSKVYNIADIDDSARVYKKEVDKRRCFVIISKKEYRLYVYEASPDGKDTILAAHFPICYAKYAEAKTQSGDMRTPESTMENPFTIKQIQDASTWHHDFGDGRGSIPSYGAWFMRLETGFSGVGIHGSTNNEASVPGRDSEGCIRLRDADLNVMHDLYAEIGQKVVIKGIQEGKYPFEKKAREALGEQYLTPKAGNKRTNTAPSSQTSSDATINSLSKDDNKTVGQLKSSSIINKIDTKTTQSR